MTMDMYDEKYEFLIEVERMCNSFPKEKESMDEEKMIVFINELKSYIDDLSYSFRDQINESSTDLEELHILQRIVDTKENAERYLIEKSLNYKQTNHDTSKEMKDHPPTLNIDDQRNTEFAEEELRKDTDHGNNVSHMNNDMVRRNKDALLFEETKNNENPEAYLNKGNQNTKDLWNTSSESYVQSRNKLKEENKNVSFEIKKQDHFDSSLGVQVCQEEASDILESDMIPMEMIEEWSNQIDAYDNLIYEYTCEYKKNSVKKRIEHKNRKKKGGLLNANLNNSSKENIDDELCLLAKEMKENVLIYRQILNEDNKFLEETASKQVAQLETMNDVSKKTKSMNQNKSISFFLSLIIIAISILLFMLTFFVILFL